MHAFVFVFFMNFLYFYFVFVRQKFILMRNLYVYLLVAVLGLGCGKIDVKNVRSCFEWSFPLSFRNKKAQPLSLNTESHINTKNYEINLLRQYVQNFIYNRKALIKHEDQCIKTLATELLDLKITDHDIKNLNIDSLELFKDQISDCIDYIENEYQIILKNEELLQIELSRPKALNKRLLSDSQNETSNRKIALLIIKASLLNNNDI